MREYFKTEAAGPVECPQRVAPEEKKLSAFSDFSVWLVHATTSHDHGSSSIQAVSNQSQKRKRVEDSALSFLPSPLRPE